jgi:hypothetical protein
MRPRRSGSTRTAPRLRRRREASVGANGELKQTLKAIEALWQRGDDVQALPNWTAQSRLIQERASLCLRASIYLGRRDDGRAQADIQSATALAKNCALTPKKQVYVLTCPSDGGELGCISDYSPLVTAGGPENLCSLMFSLCRTQDPPLEAALQPEER